MKTSTLFTSIFIGLFLGIFSFQATAQTVSEELRVKEWIDGQTITVFDHPITRVFGETYNKNEIRNYHIPITNIGYKDLAQLKNEMQVIAEDSNWTREQLDDALRNLETNVKGGRLYVYIERKENDRARANYFFVVLRDKEDKEFFQANVDKSEPQFGDFGFWSNYFEVDIPMEIDYPFFVYVNDRKSANLSDFKFEVLK